MEGQEQEREAERERERETERDRERHRFSKALCIVALYSKYTRVLTFLRISVQGGGFLSWIVVRQDNAFRDPQSAAQCHGKTGGGGDSCVCVSGGGVCAQSFLLHLCCISFDFFFARTCICIFVTLSCTCVQQYVYL